MLAQTRSVDGLWLIELKDYCCTHRRNLRTCDKSLMIF